ncbi:hypothetical protein D3C87_1834510 [compost metagenome]
MLSPLNKVRVRLLNIGNIILFMTMGLMIVAGTLFDSKSVIPVAILSIAGLFVLVANAIGSAEQVKQYQLEVEIFLKDHEEEEIESAS